MIGRALIRIALRLDYRALAACLVLAACAQQATLKHYPGELKPLEEIAVLKWHTPIVTAIDGISLKDSKRSFFIIYSDAHLLPGKHTITLRHFWADLYYDNPNAEKLTLEAELSEGHSYMVSEAPCRSCDPFAVVFWISEEETGEALGQQTMIGSGPYGEADKASAKDDESECRSNCSFSSSFCSDSGDWGRCFDEYNQCIDSCRSPLWPLD